MYLSQCKSSFFPQPSPINFSIQIPAAEHLTWMRDMPAGGAEDQCMRLSNMVAKINELHQQQPHYSLVKTDDLKLSPSWEVFFRLIQSNANQKDILKEFTRLMEQDDLVQTISAVHSKKYLRQVLQWTLSARNKDILEVPDLDLRFNRYTFELIIRDLFTTLNNPAKFLCSFGLPSHHAFADGGSGFCILDKTSIWLTSYLQKVPQAMVLVIGTDINRDNGLSANLQKMNAAQIYHLDLFDSRVYPKQGSAEIKKQFNQDEVKVGVETQAVNYWVQGCLTYYAIDLSMLPKTTGIHPALIYTLNKTAALFDKAQREQRPIILALPTGWDSHVDEKAYCAKYLGNKWMNKHEAYSSRFDNADWTYFYDGIFKLFQDNKQCLEAVYLGLEGGYEPHVYLNQITLLHQKIGSCAQPQVASYPQP
ncbi:MAG: hypothetical protein BGO90_15125 [Legionella sp. 40-6]|nr:hypothetical protein [Legionella sp.]OJY35940.1 MAG: hypothetical protein BGO90_15125 [Legionella sp. 40-6]